MKLADIMSGAGLAIYAEIALLLFLFVFVAVAARLLTTRRESLDRAARMPLDDDDPSPPDTRAARGA